MGAGRVGAGWVGGAAGSWAAARAQLRAAARAAGRAPLRRAGRAAAAAAAAAAARRRSRAPPACPAERRAGQGRAGGVGPRWARRMGTGWAGPSWRLPGRGRQPRCGRDPPAAGRPTRRGLTLPISRLARSTRAELRGPVTPTTLRVGERREGGAGGSAASLGGRRPGSCAPCGHARLALGASPATSVKGEANPCEAADKAGGPGGQLRGNKDKVS